MQVKRGEVPQPGKAGSNAIRLCHSSSLNHIAVSAMGCDHVILWHQADFKGQGSQGSWSLGMSNKLLTVRSLSECE